MGFIYSFDMSQEIAHFKSMPEHVQISAECNAVNVIYESFVIPGDQDYVTSRLLAHNGLPRGFYWAAAQAIEKYLKAFLVMNGEDVTKFKFHPVKALWLAAIPIDPPLESLEILPHPMLQAALSTPTHIKKFSTVSFIELLEKHGSADNRYNAFGVDFNTGHLWALDSLAFKIREKIGALPINDSITGLGLDLLRAFERHNPWFHESHPISSFPSSENPITYSMSVTTWEIILKNLGNPAYKIAHQWLKAKMKLPT